MRELSFIHCFGQHLRTAREWCQRYTRSKELADINQAWQLYYRVFKDLQKQLPQMTTVHLRSSSPWLLNARDLELTIPGERSSLGSSLGSSLNDGGGDGGGGDGSDDNYGTRPHICKFSPNMSVFKSKQRPRRMKLHASDGKEYSFLLKGHEDLRYCCGVVLCAEEGGGVTDV